MADRPLSRRRFLALGAAALAGGVLGAGRPDDAATEPLRLGLVLPLASGTTPVRADTRGAAGEAIRRGAVLAAEEFAASGGAPPGRPLDLRIANAPSEAAAARAAARLVAAQDAVALVGGVGDDQAAALSRVAAERDVPFVNVASSDAALRGEGRDARTLHLEAEAERYLGAITDWFAREGHRRLFLIRAGGAEGDDLRRRTLAALERRPSGLELVGEAVAAPEERTYAGALDAARAAEPDVVLLLVDAAAQLDVLAQVERRPLAAPVTGYPYAVSQTRAFHAALRDAAPRAGTGARAVLWHPAMDGAAAALAKRYRARWGVSMDAPAWAGHRAVATLVEAVVSTGASDASTLVEHLTRAGTPGGDGTFGADGQLRRPLAMVRLDPDASGSGPLTELLATMP